MVVRWVQIVESRLLVHRDRIIDGGWNVQSLQGILQACPDLLILHLQGILRPARVITFRNHRGLDHTSQLLRITACHLVDILKFILSKSFQFDQKHSSLNAVHTRIHANANIVVAVAAFAVDMIRLEQRCPLVIVGEHCATVTITSNGLGREKRSGGNVTKSTGFLFADASTKALGTVFQDIEVILFSHLANCLEIGREAEQIDCNDHTRCE